MKGLHEILTTKLWMVQPEAVVSFRRSLEENLNAHALFEDKKQIVAKVMRRGMEGKYHAAHMMYEDDEVWDTDQDASEEDSDSYVCCVWIDGGVTRNGGGCSYGSKEHRDIIMQCADEKECHGILFYLNTPGGSASAIPDYKYAIDYAHSKGLPVLGFVDGLAASAGIYIAALCDERYFMNPKDQVGSIGVMAAWYSLKDGEKDYSGDTYHEVYGPKSVHKNEWYRKSVDGDYKLILADLEKLEDEFFADVKAACPKVDEKEHLGGKMFDCGDVTGILVDGQKTFDECLERIDELYRASHQKPSSSVDGVNATDDGAQENAAHLDMTNYQLTNIANMDKKYMTIASLAGVQELHASEEGVFLNAPLIDNINANLKQSREAYETKVSLASKEKQEALDAQKADYDKQLADMQAKLDEKTQALADLQAKFDTKQGEVDAHAETIKAKDAAIAEKDQKISDLQAKVAQLNGQPGAAPEAGASPANNGAGVQAEGFVCECPQYDASLSPEENKKRMDEYTSKLGQERYGV